MQLSDQIAHYSAKYPQLSDTAVATRMIEDGVSELALRTLRRYIGAYRLTHPAIQTDTDIVKPLKAYSKFYTYDEGADSYLFFLPGEKPFHLSGETLRNLKRQYSNWNGEPATINQICRRFAMSRALFQKLRVACGWTHDSEPFTDEELLQRSEDEMLDDLVQQRKFSLEQRMMAQKLREQELDAKKWQDFKRGLLNPFEEQLHARLLEDRPQTYKGEGDLGYGCVMAPFDLHYGKYAWAGETASPYSREMAKARFRSATTDLLEDVRRYAVETFIVPIGSDFFHIDTAKGTTTTGTPQDVDGTVNQIMAEGFALMIEYIDRLREVADVKILLCAGNHDRLLSSALLLYLEGYYRNATDVQVVVSHNPRQYVQWGDTLIGFTHGDGVKTMDLPLLMESDNRSVSAAKKIWFTGHLHHEKVDIKGTLVFQMPSLSGADRWHEQNSHVNSSPGMNAYLICPKRGIRHQIYNRIY